MGDFVKQLLIYDFNIFKKIIWTEIKYLLTPTHYALLPRPTAKKTEPAKQPEPKPAKTWGKSAAKPAEPEKPAEAPAKKTWKKAEPKQKPVEPEKPALEKPALKKAPKQQEKKPESLKPESVQLKTVKKEVCTYSINIITLT